MPGQRILSVGQCGYDRARLSRQLKAQFEAEVVSAETFEEALAEMRSARYTLVLVNRVTDADDSQGIDLIRRMKDEVALAALPVMLVSDFPEAQAQAVALGALRGFGKSALSDPNALESSLDPVLRSSS